MKLVVISDTHSLHEEMKYEIPDGDVLIHCGDICNRGTTREVIYFMEWFESHPHKSKIFIAGNHDFIMQRKDDTVINALKKYQTPGTNLYYLEDSHCVIDNIKFWGSPWTPQFGNWSFMKWRGTSMAEVWAKIHDDTNVLITHGPPMTDSFIDRTIYGNEQVGCEELSKRLLELPNLKYNFFGHIHEGYGDFIHPSGVELHNASVCTLRYSPSNKPIEVYIS